MDRLKLVKEENEEENEEEDEEEDNLLTYLAVLFGQVTLGDSSPADSHEVRREEELASPPDSEHASSTSPLLGEGCSTPKANSSNLCPDFSSDSLQQANRAGALPSPITTNNHEQSQELPSLATNEPILSQGTPTSSVPDLEASIGQSPLECEGARETLSDTHTERADSAPSTPKDGASVLPGSIKEEENDDPLACLADQLAGTTLDGTDDTGRRVRSERVEDELTRPSPPKLEIDDKSQIKTKMSSVPSTPASKALDGRYYFCALSGVYYFDNYHNVFFHDGTLIHDGSDALDWDDLLTPHFYLDDIAFWFDDQGLLFQGTDGIPYRADVWPNEQQWDQPDQSQTSSFTSDATIDATYTPTVKRKATEDEPVQAYAYPTKVDANNDKYCFYASGQLYYFDSNRRLFSVTGKLIYDGSASFMARQSTLPNFHIDEVAYWFEPDGLSARGVSGTRYPVHTWLSEQKSLDSCQTHAQRLISKNRRTASALDPRLTSYSDPNAVPIMTPYWDGASNTTPKADSCSPGLPSKSLQDTLQGKANIMLSPSSSLAPETPNNPPTNVDYPPPHELPLFPASEPGFIQHVSIGPEWMDNMVGSNKTPGKVQSGKKQRGEEHRRCPYCLKVFRRPCALAEHINTHTGAKPHMCPFVDCNTGFATRQNMRRHFLTHQVGEIEKYTPGMTQGSAANKRRKPQAETLLMNSGVSFVGRLRLSSSHN